MRLAAKETVICTFTNQRQPTGTIAIRKQTDPKDSSTVFSFFGPEDDFDLSDGETHTMSDVRTGEHRFFEEVPDGWSSTRSNATTTTRA